MTDKTQLSSITDSSSLPGSSISSVGNGWSRISSSKNTSSRTAKNLSFKNWILVALLVLTLGSGAVLIFGLPSENLDTRNQASEGNSFAIIDSIYEGQLPPTVGTPVVLSFRINTQSINTDGVQLQLNLAGRDSNNNMALVYDPSSLVASVVTTGTGLFPVVNRIVHVPESGSNITLFATPSSPPIPLNTSQPQQFLSLRFIPTIPGSIDISAMQANSLVTRKNSSPPENILGTIAPLHLNIGSISSPGPTSQPSPLPTTNTTPAPSPVSNLPPDGDMKGVPELTNDGSTTPADYVVTINNNTTLNLYGTGTDDHDAPEQLSYKWLLQAADGTGPQLQLLTKDIVLPPSVYQGRLGQFIVRLTATDTLRLADPTPKTLLITVLPQPTKPKAEIKQPSTDPTSILVGTAQQFIGQGTDSLGFTDNLSYRWSFSDGYNNKSKSFTRSFKVPGTITVKLVVTDSKGVSSDPAQMTINVTKIGIYKIR